MTAESWGAGQGEWESLPLLPEVDCSPRARPLVGLGSWGGDRTRRKLRVRDPEAPGMGRVSSPM